MKKTTKLKEFIKKFKELWTIPRYRAIIKLSLYGIMFLLIIIMANLYNETNINSNEHEKNKSYTEIINAIDLNNTEINYTLKTLTNEYKLEGEIESNILEGYIDDSNTINKIKIKDNNIYELRNKEETISEKFNSLNQYFLIPGNIIELVRNEQAYINKGIEVTSYTFNVTYNNINYEIKIILNSDSITQITIKNTEILYELNFNFDKKV